MNLDEPWKGLDDALIGCKAAFYAGQVMMQMRRLD